MIHVFVTRAIYLSVSYVCNLIDKARFELDLPSRWKLFGSSVYNEYQLIIRNFMLFLWVFMRLDTLTAYSSSFKQNLNLLNPAMPLSRQLSRSYKSPHLAERSATRALSWSYFRYIIFFLKPTCKPKCN